MSGMSDYLENALIDHLLRGTTLTAPANVYIALFTSAGSLAELEAGTLTNEVSDSGTAYARATLSTSGGTEWNAGSNGVTANTNNATFATAIASWGTIRFAAVMDGPTAGSGNVLFYGQLAADKTVNASDTFQFNSGDFQITLA